MKRMQTTDPPKQYTGPSPYIMEPCDYHPEVFGGSTTIRALHWNVRTINTDKRQKLHFLRSANPLVASIQETRDPLPEISGFTSINASPRTCADNALKTNAALLISAEV